MSKLESRWSDLRHLDDLANQNTVIHRLSPLAKLLTTLAYLLAVTSFSRYEVTALLPFAFYPVFLISLSELPFGLIAKRLIWVLPFILFIGIFNPLFDSEPLIQLGTINISGGWLSFTSILLRSLFAVTAAILLLATTGMEGICLALFRLKVPRVFVVQLLFMYRYIYVLLDELARTLRAYSFRSFHGNGLGFQVWGSLLGQLLLRTIDRAQRIYYAMLCRGFTGEFQLIRHTSFTTKDLFFVVGWLVFFVVARCINIPQWLGTLLLGGYR